MALTTLRRRISGGRTSSRTWSRKFADAFRGLARAVRTQSSFAVHILVAGAVVTGGAMFRVSAVEWCLLAFAIGLVLMAEIFNTAIESLARAPGSRRHPRFRDALDMASAAVLLAAITAATIGVIVFGPRIVMWMPR
ncbi:MAG: diacylglycerol kinase [Planctomycetia bacterium]|nr:diacylglycerol kinase [Planctomycetia bacterium]